MNNEKNYVGFHIPKIWKNLKLFAGNIFIMHKPLASEEWQIV